MDEPQPSVAHEIPEEIRELVKPELEPGERLIWAAQPVAMPGALPDFVLAWIWAAGFLAISLLAFAAYFGAFGRRVMEIGAPLSVAGLGSGIIAVLIAVGSFANWLSERPRRRLDARKRYALTDRRVIVWSPLDRYSVRVDSFYRGKIQDVHRVETADGSGSVVLHCPSKPDYSGTNSLIGIPEARRVEDMIRRVLIVPGPEPGP